MGAETVLTALNFEEEDTRGAAGNTLGFVELWVMGQWIMLGCF